MSIEQQIDRLCNTIQVELDSYRRFMALHEPELTPRFNMTSLLWPDENRLSSVIATLLDPNGPHGQGALPLKLFLENIGKPLASGCARTEKQLKRLDTISRIATNNPNSNSILEKSTKENRRIDIVLELNSFYLAIENKPWTIDQERQIEDYLSELECLKIARQLSDQDSNFLLIYLSSDGEPPSVGSINGLKFFNSCNSGDLMVVSYAQCQEWLLELSIKVKSHKLRILLEDFCAYLKMKFEGGLRVEENEIIINRCIERNNIASAISIAWSWPEISKKLIFLLAEKMHKKELGDSWENPNVDFNINANHSSFRFKKISWKNINIIFGFDGKNATGMCFGICKESKDIPNNIFSIVVKKLNEEFNCVAKESDWWPWYQEAPDRYRNWNSDVSIWDEIPSDGRIVDDFSKILRKIKNAVEMEIDKVEENI